MAFLFGDKRKKNALPSDGATDSPAAIHAEDIDAVVVQPKKPRKDRSHWLYIGVIIAVIAGIAFGLVAPAQAAAIKPMGTVFVSLIKMMIAPIIFTTIVLGIGSVRATASVGKIGGIALAYFMTLTVVALFIGLGVGNLIQPGEGLHIQAGSGADVLSGLKTEGESHHGVFGFIQSLIPTTVFSAFTEGSVLQVLFVALLVGFAVQKLGKTGEKFLAATQVIQTVTFKVLTMILWLAPLGAFGAMAGVVGETGIKSVGAMMVLMLAFYITCFLFVFLFLGAILWFVAKVNVWTFLKYLGREFLLILATSSSESALPNLMAKLEHAGVSKTTVGIVVPTGYSFNLDGTAIYLTMASIFISDAMGMPMNLGEQLGLLVFMIVASKGAAGISGAGIATLAAGLQTARPDLLDGVGLIVGIDRFMSEARALTNFAGNSIATIVVGTWTHSVDRDQLMRTIHGEDPFDYESIGQDAEMSANLSHGVVDPAAELPKTPYPVVPEGKGVATGH